MPSQETEWEKLIRLGQMTPFGTRIPQKEVKKEPRKVMLAENSAFDQYLADQAKLATERKRVPFLKRKSSGLTGKDSTGKNRRPQSSSKDKKMRKRMQKLQIMALKAHPKARPKTEPQQFKPKKKHYEGEETESEGSEYLPSDEGIDPDQEAQEAIEEGFGLDDDDEYKLKPYKTKTEVKARKRVKKKEESEEEYTPESSDEDEDDDKGKLKKYKDDGDVEYYKRRIRYADHARLLLLPVLKTDLFSVFVIGGEAKEKTFGILTSMPANNVFWKN